MAAEHLSRATIPVRATIADAMRSLEASMTQIVLVVDESNRLVGTLTDGDLRRALLEGADMRSDVADHVNRDCFIVGPDAARAEVLDLMQARQIAQVPAVDDERRIVGLHLLHDLISNIERPNWAVVMAGGRGARLGDLTQAVPKPMLQVAGRPILERIVLQLVGSGIRRIFLSVNYLAAVIETHFGDGHRFGCSIDYLREDAPLGTGGALALLPRGPGEPAHPVLVMNGDLVTQANFGRLIDAHEAGGQTVTMAVRRYVHQLPYGVVDLDGDTLLGFEEKPSTERFINAGIYVLDAAPIRGLGPAEPFTMPEFIERIRAEGGVARVVEVADDWNDVGARDQFDRARHGA
jgi:dTDP-glucose pyrophosphorylase